MRRAIFTLVALGVLLPLAAETARAGDRDRHRGRREKSHNRHRRHSSKGLEIRAGLGGISIAYHRTKHRGRRHGRRHGRSIRLGLYIGLPRLVTPRHWVPGHYVVEERRVRTPDRIESVWIPDRYESRCDGLGRRYRVLVEGGHRVERVIPGAIVVERVKVWVAGHWDRD